MSSSHGVCTGLCLAFRIHVGRAHAILPCYVSSFSLSRTPQGTESMEDDESLTVFINVEGYRVSDSIQPVLPHSL